MKNLKEKILNEILPYVQKPGRYIGMEVNSVVKDPENVDLKLLLAFPDVYEIGMSHFGLKVLYDIVNKDRRFCAERAFAPWPDMEGLMRKKGVPLYSLENFLPAKSFDVIGFSLQYELSYTNILNMLDLGGLPVYARDREDGSFPFVIGGGPCVFNPEPVADFFDAIFVGEAEETLLKFMELVNSAKGTASKKEILATAAKTIDGVYVPSLYGPSGNFDSVEPLYPGLPVTIKKAVVEDLNKFPSPLKQLVPLIGIVHDRAALEIMRGCAKGCRFCQAGSIYRPIRHRARETLLKEARELIRNTGYQEISLLSLSTGDYPDIEKLIEDLVNEFDRKKVSISIPSLRVDSFSVELAAKIKEVKKTGFTFACEAGTERLLEVIRKEINFNELFSAVENAYRLGWKLIKLYFMIGLPGETYDDLDKIAHIIYKVSDIKRQVDGRPADVNVTISSFVPKPHTPFQWVGMNPVNELPDKQDYLKRKINGRRFKLNFHEVEKNFLEAVISRGDRRISSVIFEAWKSGARFDDWREYFNFNTWKEAFRKCDIAPEAYTRAIDVNAKLPWEHISTGVKKEALLNEYKKALELIKNE